MTVAIIQARMTSTRLPNKVLMVLYGKPVLQNIIERVKRAKLVDEVVIATSSNVSDDQIERFSNEKHIKCFRGSLNNVLERFYLCATEYKADMIVRLTADNALVAPEVIDEAIKEYNQQQMDYLYYKDTLPLGMCVEVFSYSALEQSYHEAKDIECLEHVTPYIRKNPSKFKAVHYHDSADADHSTLRLTMDTQKDFELISKLYEYFHGNDFTYEEVLKAFDAHADWRAINQDVAQKQIGYCGE